MDRRSILLHPDSSQPSLAVSSHPSHKSGVSSTFTVSSTRAFPDMPFVMPGIVMPRVDAFRVSSQPFISTVCGEKIGNKTPSEATTDAANDHSECSDIH